MRIWTILVTGILIGPASLAFWGLFRELRGGDPLSVWYGDPPGIGLGAAIVFALIVGFLTTSVYVFALKRRQRQHTVKQGRIWRGAI